MAACSRGHSSCPAAGQPPAVRRRDIHTERGRLLALGIDVSRVTALPGFVAFVDFADPRGNALGLYQDLAPSGQQPVVGGSVHDEDQFVTE